MNDVHLKTFENKQINFLFSHFLTHHTFRRPTNYIFYLYIEKN